MSDADQHLIFACLFGVVLMALIALDSWGE